MYVLDFMYNLKYHLVGPPNIYFGVEIKKHQVSGGKSCCSMLSKNCVKNSIKRVERILKDYDRLLRKVKLAGEKPFPNRYH